MTNKMATLFIALLAAVVRLNSLNRYLIIDEEDRWNWAVDFYRALLRGDLPATLVGDGYPGIFPVWLETLWLAAVSLYRSALQGSWIGEAGVNALVHEWGRLSHLAQQRFPIVLVNILLVIFIYLYARRLFGGRIAFLAGVLIALDPFYLSDSRVNRAEGLITGLMAVSFLALIVSLQESKRRHLVISALFGGLAWLTKSQALVLLPLYGAITLIWHLRNETRRQRALGQWLLTMLSWTFLAALLFFVLWPAAWTVPGDTFGLMYSYLTRKVGAEGVNLFFLGRARIDADPGILFYPVIFLLRISPVTLIGLGIGVWLLIRRLLQAPRQDWKKWLDDEGVWMLLAYSLLYAGGMTLGSHKQDRFLMTVFPMLDILAAYSFVRLAERLIRPGRYIRIAVGALLIVQLAIVLPYNPYYFSYFNPLLGGGATASRLTRIGWGEGMDQVGAYLHTLPDSKRLRVASRFYKYLLGFEGEALNLDADGEWLQADKIVFYIQQVQRMQDPSPGVIRYFQRHVPPEKVISINGINYASIYPNPVVYNANPLVDRIAGQLALFGYRLETDMQGEPEITLIWENLGESPAAPAIRLAAADDDFSNWLPCAVSEGFEAAAATPGEIVESDCPLSVANLSPGVYSLQVGLQDATGKWQTLDFAAGWRAVERTEEETVRYVERADAYEQLAQAAIPPSATRLEHTYAYKIHLLGYEISAEVVEPGQSLTVTLYWQANRPLRDNAYVTIQAFTGEQQLINKNGPPLKGQYPTAAWRPGEVISEQWTIDLPADAPAPALLSLGVGLFDPDTVVPWQVRNRAGVDIPNEISRLRILPQNWAAYRGEEGPEIVFDDKIGLLSYDISPNFEANVIDVTLTWLSQAPVAEDYTAFVHLLDETGALAAQSDVPPQHGLYPTSAWRPGDVVESYHQLALPANLPGGVYTLLVGLYRPEDWQRLAIIHPADITVENNAAPIDYLTIP